MLIVVFCDKEVTAKKVSREILLSVGDHVNGRTSDKWSRITIDSKNIVIDMRKADIERAAGLRPDYVLFYDASSEFVEYWRYNMGGRYTELKTLDELIWLVIKEE